MAELLHADESYLVRGACYEVYREMGSGFLESVYQESLQIEFGLRDILFVAQPRLRLAYKQRRLKSEFVPDFICFEKIVVELKAISSLTDQHRGQVHNYLKATGCRLGLIVSFGHFPKIEIERIVR